MHYTQNAREIFLSGTLKGGLTMNKIDVSEAKKKILESLKELRKTEIEKKIEQMKKISDDYCTDMKKLSESIIQKWKISAQSFNEIQDKYDGDLKNNPCRENKIMNELDKESQKILAKYHFNETLEKKIGFKVLLDPDEHGTVVSYLDEALNIILYSKDNFEITLDHTLDEAIESAFKKIEDK